MHTDSVEHSDTDTSIMDQECSESDDVIESNKKQDQNKKSVNRKKNIQETPLSLYQEYSSLRLQTALTHNMDIVPFPIGTDILVLDQARQLWPATITQIEGSKRMVHYEGWGSEYDEWIDADSKRLQMKQADTSHVVNVTQKDTVTIYSRTGTKLNKQRQSILKRKPSCESNSKSSNVIIHF